MRAPPLPLAALGLLLLLGGCKTEIYAGLPEQEANQMVAILLRAGIPAAKSQNKDGTDAIEVERSRFADAVAALDARGYPRKRFESMGDVFKPSGLVASPLQERARFLWALSQELSGTVAEIDGVLTARVQVVLPDNDLLNRDPAPSSASVFVRYDTDSDVARLVPQIKMLVANSVEGLSYDKVSVVLVPVAHVAAPPPAPASAAGDPALPLEASGGAAAALLLGAAFLARRRIAALFDHRPARDALAGPAE